MSTSEKKKGFYRPGEASVEPEKSPDVSYSSGISLSKRSKRSEAAPVEESICEIVSSTTPASNPECHSIPTPLPTPSYRVSDAPHKEEAEYKSEEPIAHEPVASICSSVSEATPVLTTLGTNKAYVIFHSCSTVLCILLAIYVINYGSELYASFWYRDEGTALVGMGWMFILLNIIEFVYHLFVSQTYCDVFPDRIKGEGMQTFQHKSFNLQYQNVTSICMSGGFLGMAAAPGVYLVVSTPTGSYKVLTSKACAETILEYYTSQAK